jgi:hypothetical protein
MGPRTATARSPAKATALLVPLALVPGCVFAADTLNPCIPTGAGASDNAYESAGPRTGTAGNTLDLGIDAGVGASDNIFEVAGPKTSEIMPTAGLLLAAQRCTGSLTGSVDGDFAYYDYARHSYSNDLYGRLDANLSMALVPERVSWVLNESFGQEALSPFDPLTPANRENVNVVSTGPDIVEHFGQEFVRLGLRYAAVQYQKSPFDNQRPFGSFALGHELSADSTVSLNVDAEEVRFSNTTVNTDFDRREAYLRYEARGARTALALNLGAAQTTLNESWYSTPLVQLDLTRHLTRRMTLTLSGGEQQLDTAGGFVGLQPGAIGGIITAPAPETTFTYVARFGSGSWRWDGIRTSIAVSDRWESDSYLQDSIFNNKRNDLELSLGRQLSRALNVQILGSVLNTDYSGEDFRSLDRVGAAALVLHAAPKLDVTLRYDHWWRTVSGGGAAGFTGFNENRVFLMATYWPVRTGGVMPAAGAAFPMLQMP